VSENYIYQRRRNRNTRKRQGGGKKIEGRKKDMARVSV
jgi:hypothetical protein